MTKTFYFNKHYMVKSDKEIELSAKMTTAPSQTGCYLWLGMLSHEKKLRILYVGKAKNLKNRIRQYFHSDEYKTRFLMSKVSDIDWIVTSSEMEALLLESNLIKKHNPPYNVRLKDDKRYPYLCLTLDETYPRLFITRRKSNLNHAYFGPFSDVKAARSTMAMVNKIFPIRKRALKFPLKKPQKPCLNYHLKRCWAPCAGKVDADEYRNMINQIKDFLEGKSSLVQNNLENQMKRYSEKLEFEKAGRIRDILTDIEKTTQWQSVHEENSGYNYDIAGLFLTSKDDLETETNVKINLIPEKHPPEKIYLGQIVILKIRNGNLTGKENYALSEAAYMASSENETISRKPAKELYTEYIEAFFLDYYLRCIDYPDSIFVSNKISSARYWEKTLKEQTGKAVKILEVKTSQKNNHPSKENIKNLMKMAVTNAKLSLRERILSEHFKDKRRGLRQLQSILKLSKFPEIIECYDISNIQGEEAVAAGVMFKDGIPHKAGYRKYKIKTVEGANDPAMIYEAISRRMKKLTEKKVQLPDLIVIDGGITQLNAAIHARDEVGISLKIISLAKKEEEIYLETREILKMDKDSPGMLILRHARDEAHRFSLSYHRSLRIKKNLSSMFDDIPGIAEKTSKKLIAILRKVELFELDESALRQKLTETVKINKKLADIIIKKIYVEK